MIRPLALALCLTASAALAAPPPVEAINLAVNAAIGYGPTPTWSELAGQPCPATGDCKAYAVCKLWHLRSYGISGVVVVYWHAERRQRHAVAVVDGGWVLDSLTREVRPWQAPRDWWAMQPVWGETMAVVAINGRRIR